MFSNPNPTKNTQRTHLKKYFDDNGYKETTSNQSIARQSRKQALAGVYYSKPPSAVIYFPNYLQSIMTYRSNTPRRLEDYYAYKEEETQQHSAVSFLMLVILGFLVSLSVVFFAHRCYTKRVRPFLLQSKAKELTVELASAGSASQIYSTYSNQQQQQQQQQESENTVAPTGLDARPAWTDTQDPNAYVSMPMAS
jgi:hypothetical protein